MQKCFAIIRFIVVASIRATVRALIQYILVHYLYPHFLLALSLSLSRFYFISLSL